MIQKILKYGIVALLIVNLPTALLNIAGPAIGSLSSYVTFLLIIVYYIFYSREAPNFWLLYIGMAYFIIASIDLSYYPDQQNFLMLFAKFSVLAIFGNGLFRSVSKKEMLFFLGLGALTVVVNAVVFPSVYGRAGGFYYNPNFAGFVCLYGYALSYTLPRNRMRLFIQVFFSFAGFLTFSRTFLLLWILVNLISVKIDRRNSKLLIMGVIAFLMLLIAGEALNLGGNRYNAFRSIISDGSSSQSLTSDSRTETWARFYDEVMEYPLLGGGFGKFQGGGVKGQGSHNTYLLLIGESGILPLIMFLAYFLYLSYQSLLRFKQEPSLLLMTLVLALYLLTTHNFFDNYVKLGATLFLHAHLWLEIKKGETVKPQLSKRRSAFGGDLPENA